VDAIAWQVFELSIEWFAPHAWWIIGVVVAVALLRMPLLTRAPLTPRRDPWRTFRFGPRAAVLERAGGRCEAALFFLAGRCGARATQVDHIIPWSRGGPTVERNAQALCAAHNRSKAARVPAWWYILRLERSRRGYFPEGADVRVLARMSEEDRAARHVPRAPEPRRRIRSRTTDR